MLNECDQHKVFCVALAFYQKSLSYILQKAPLNDSQWNTAIWINYFKRASPLWSDIIYFCTRFAHALNFTQEESEMSYEQFLYYWTMKNIEIKEAKLKGHENEYRMDTICSILKSMVSATGNAQYFGILFELLILFSVFHIQIPEMKECTVQ